MSSEVLVKKIRRKAVPIIVSSIKKINLVSFREFSTKEFLLGSKLTAIAGHNSTGKSTILAVIGNSCEFKDAKPLIKPNFRSELEQVIKCSVDNDPPQKKALEITFTTPQGDENNNLTVPFRFGWWDYKTRPRLVPKHENGESKLAMPVLYLGLTRLMPLGECEGDGTPSAINKYLEDFPDDKAWLKSKFAQIFSNAEREIQNVASLQHQDAKKKTFFGIKTNKYDERCNSAGEDNIGQILLGILSFKKAKREAEQSNIPWHGGIFLIDELDATIHPAAQERLLDVLAEAATDLNLQVVFTTHSLSLINCFYKKPQYANNTNDHKVLYITNRNGALEIIDTPKFEVIKHDMLLSDPAMTNNIKIHVYTEDPEARWFMREIVDSSTLTSLNLLETHISCSTLVKLNSEAYDDFKTSLIVLDADYTDRLQKYNIILLPSHNNSNPENTIFEYLIGLPAEHPLWSESNNPSFVKRSIAEYGPNSPKYAAKAKLREKYKQWFIDNKDNLIAADVMKHWKRDNNEIVATFNKKLVTIINSLKMEKARLL